MSEELANRKLGTFLRGSEGKRGKTRRKGRSPLGEGKGQVGEGCSGPWDDQFGRSQLLDSHTGSWALSCTAKCLKQSSERQGPEPGPL